MESDEIEWRSGIRRFLGRICDTSDLADDDDIFARGFINSLHAIQLVGFVEKRLGGKLRNDELDIRNFRSIDAILEFVARRRAGSPASR